MTKAAIVCLCVASIATVTAAAAAGSGQVRQPFSSCNKSSRSGSSYGTGRGVAGREHDNEGKGRMRRHAERFGGALKTTSTKIRQKRELSPLEGIIATLRGGTIKNASGGTKAVSALPREAGLVEAPQVFKLRGGTAIHEGGDPHGEMSVATAVLNIVADLCPHGMLPVAYGMAAFGGTGLVVAPALLAAFGIVSAYTMVSLGRASERTRLWSFRSLWAELVGKDTAWVIEVAMALLTFGCCIFYMAFAGDLFSALAQTASFLPDILKKRAVDLGLLSLFPVLPLCLMKNLNALQYTSFFGVVSILYTVSFVIKRSLDGSYSEAGRFFEAIEAKYRSPVPQPWDSVKLWRVGPGLATLMNMSCVAFMCHYNGVKYYEELRHRTVKKYAVTIGISMTICLGVFSLMMLFGYRTFGAAAQALILNNYHRADDPLASLARVATGCSILCGYPLMFAALKTSFFNAASEIADKLGDAGKKISPRFQNDEELRLGCILSLMAVITTVACYQSEEDLGLIVGLIGAVLGSAANYIIPAVLNLSLLRRGGTKRGLLSEATLNKAIIVFGVLFMIAGTASVFQQAGSHGGESHAKVA